MRFRVLNRSNVIWRILVVAALLLSSTLGRALGGNSSRKCRGTLAPVAAYYGEYELCASQLSVNSANSPHVFAVVSVLDRRSEEVVRDLHLPNGSTCVKDIKLPAHGKYAAVTHLIANFNRPTIHLGQNWMAGNALTILDVVKLEVLGTVLLDDPGRGAANPWGLAWTDDAKTLVVAHAGTHEVSIIDFPALLEAVLKLPAPISRDKLRTLQGMAPQELDLTAYTPFFPSPRRRVKLPPGDLGPRSVTIVGRTAYVTNYFSETVTVMDLAASTNKPISISLHPGHMKSRGTVQAKDPLAGMSLARKGEFYFHDATICFKGWQSCSSCHPDGRSDGLNWDLLNDGIGNPKNTKSLLFAHKTPPAMWIGVRETAEAAVRAGLRHILFTNAPEEIALAIDEYLKSLKPEPSPYLVSGRLSPSAEHGKQVFVKAGCITCHPSPLFTDQHSYDVGTRASFDKPIDLFDTPTLIELWRTPPYLHDGSAPTVRDVVTMRNQQDKHGHTSNLSPHEIDDLCAYLLSL